MKSWTLLLMACLLMLAAPTSSLAESATEEPVAAAETVAGDTPEPEAVESAEMGAAASVPLPLDPARQLPEHDGSIGSFAFGPLGVDSEGRTGRIHLVTSGDTLWDISEAYLGTPWVWPSVWDENSEIENPHLIVPGDRIWISSTEMRRVSDTEAAALVAAAQAEPEDPTPVAELVAQGDLIEPVPAALDETPMAVPMAVTGPAPEKKSISIDWKESMGFLSKDRIDASSSIVSSPSVRTWLSQGDPVRIGLGSGQVKVGDQFLIFDELMAVRSLRTEMLLGYHITPLGWVEVTGVAGESSAGIIREAWVEIERGARIAPRGDPSLSFDVTPAPADITGQVVFTPSDRKNMGTIDHVYLDIGANHGLSVGSELNLIDPAYESFDGVRGVDVLVPDYSTGQLVIISTQPRSSVALVTHTRREVEIGQLVQGSAR